MRTDFSKGGKTDREGVETQTEAPINCFCAWGSSITFDVIVGIIVIIVIVAIMIMMMRILIIKLMIVVIMPIILCGPHPRP